MAVDLPVRAPLTFRRMRDDDLDRVVENETRSYAFPWTRGVFIDCLQARHECWVADRDAQLIGHGVLSVAASEAHLLNVCVRRDHQGQGLGRQLVVHMLTRARECGARAVFLEVRPSNRVACALYESLGFREIGRRKAYYPAEIGNEDAMVLTLSLGVVDTV
jgi:[ribosomal protein S18]-alanine N-acetyltransferase